MDINFREGFLFRATDPKGRVSPKPFEGSTVANSLRLHLIVLSIDEGETMHRFRSACSITLFHWYNCAEMDSRALLKLAYFPSRDLSSTIGYLV